MWVVYAILSAIVFGTASVIMKTATLKKCIDQYVLWGLYFTGSLFFFSQCFNEFSFNHNYLFYIWVFLIGLGSFYGNWFIIKALEIGPASLTAPMLNLNIPFIILMSVLFYGESINLLKIIIISLLLISVLIVKIDPNEKFVIKDYRWFVWVILGSFFLFLREGGLKITQELNFNNNIILLFAYLFCLFLSSIALFLKEIKLQKNNFSNQYFNFKIFLHMFKEKNRIYGLYFGLITGICSGVGLYFFSYALQTGSASIATLIFSARSLVIVVLSYFIHKERLSLFQKISVTLLCIGLALASYIK